MEFIAANANETKKLGKKIGSDLAMMRPSPVTNVLALTGDLGSGKTTFVQGLAEGLGIKQRIISPTYIIVRKYELKLKTNSSNLPARAKLKAFYHVDLYRLEGSSSARLDSAERVGEASIEREIENLGLKDIWSDPENVVAIEWAEKAKEFLPYDSVWVSFKNLGESERRIIINYV